MFTRSPLAQDIRAPRRRSRNTRQTDGQTDGGARQKKAKQANRQTDRRTGSSALSSCQPRSRRQKGNCQPLVFFFVIGILNQTDGRAVETPTRRRIYRESGTGAAQKRKEKEVMAVVFHRRRRQESGRRPLLCDDRGRKMAFRFWVKACDNSRRHYLASVLLIGALQRMEERLHQRASRCPDAPSSPNPALVSRDLERPFAQWKHSNVYPLLFGKFSALCSSCVRHLWISVLP